MSKEKHISLTHIYDGSRRHYLLYIISDKFPGGSHWRCFSSSRIHWVPLGCLPAQDMTDPSQDRFTSSAMAHFSRYIFDIFLKFGLERRGIFYIVLHI